jgi:hypothetical protein
MLLIRFQIQAGLASIIICTMMISATFACRKPVSDKQIVAEADLAGVQKIRPVKVGELHFRKSYAGHEKMTAKELQEMENALPNADTFGWDYCKPALLKFQQVGFVKGDKLLLHRLRTDTTVVFEVTAPGMKAIPAFIKQYYDGIYGITFSTGAENWELCFRMTSIVSMTYLLLDIIPGGYPELVLADFYYIMNGDNYDFWVYEFR